MLDELAGKHRDVLNKIEYSYHPRDALKYAALLADREVCGAEGRRPEAAHGRLITPLAVVHDRIKQRRRTNDPQQNVTDAIGGGTATSVCRLSQLPRPQAFWYTCLESSWP